MRVTTFSKIEASTCLNRLTLSLRTFTLRFFPFFFFTPNLQNFTFDIDFDNIHKLITGPFTSFLGTLSTLSQSSPIQFKSFVPLKHVVSVSDGQPDSLIQNSYRFVLTGSQYAYLYNQQAVLCCNGENKKPVCLSNAYLLCQIVISCWFR